MGHEIVVYGDRAASINDLDFEAIRHFLLTEAERAGAGTIASFVRNWKHEGPGVWTGEDFDSFFHRDPALEREFVALLGAADDRVRAFGEVVPVAYVKAHVNPTWRESPKSSGWLEAIRKLRELFPILPGEAVSAAAVAVVWASSRKQRAEILRRDDGLFQVFVYREVPGDGEWEAGPYWSPVGREAILADTLERAKTLAEEELRLVSA